MANYDALVAPATRPARTSLPRVAATLDVMQISDITKVVSPDTFERPIYAGNAIQTVQSADRQEGHHRAHPAFPAAAEGGSAAIETVVGARCRRRSRRSRRPSSRNPTGPS